MIRARFKTNHDDPRPVNWPIKHPYWITGYAGDDSYATVVAYADDEDYIIENWPEATDIEVETVENYVYTNRFPRPDWLTQEK